MVQQSWSASATEQVTKIADIQTEKQTDTENKVKAVGQHCAAHKLNLAASKTGNTFPVIARFKKTLNKLT